MLIFMIVGLCGLIFGCVLREVIFYAKTGYGYFTIEPLPDEEGFYTVNIRLDPDQKLNKKTQIVLKRERVNNNSQK